MIPDYLLPHSRPWIGRADQHAVTDVLASGMIAQGHLTTTFERAVCDYLGASHAIAQSSGTAAMILALRTLSVGSGDEVILPTYVCRSVLEAVLTVGATPRLCDVDDSGVLSAEKVAPLVTDDTKAVIAVHIFGHPCDLISLESLGYPVIEDACQSFGLSIRGRMAATVGTIGVLSFHATKCLTCGEGGMLITQNHFLAERARLIAKGGSVPAERSFAPLADLQASLGLSQLSRYDKFLERRAVLRGLYAGAAQSACLRIGASDHSDMLFRFTLRLDAPFERVRSIFEQRGVSVRRGVDELLHRLVGLDDKDFPNATRLFNQTVSVPFYPALSDEQAMAVANVFSVLKHGC